MLYVLCGEESFLINKKCDELIKESKVSNIIRYDMDEYSFSDILTEVYYVDLFNEKKLVIASNFSFKMLSSEEEEAIIRFLNDNNDNIIIIRCINEKLDERKKIIKLLRDKKCIIEFKKLMYFDLEKYIYDYLINLGYKVSIDTIKKLVKKLEYNSDLVFSECEKLMMYKYDDKIISSDDIDEVVTKNFEKEIFAFSNAVMNKDLGNIFSTYNNLINMKIEIMMLIEYLSKQFRTLYQIKNLTGNFNEIARELGVNEYVVKVLSNSLKLYNENEILNILCKLYDVDVSIKEFGYDAQKVFENFLLNFS